MALSCGNLIRIEVDSLLCFLVHPTTYKPSRLAISPFHCSQRWQLVEILFSSGKLGQTRFSFPGLTVFAPLTTLFFIVFLIACLVASHCIMPRKHLYFSSSSSFFCLPVLGFQCPSLSLSFTLSFRPVVFCPPFFCLLSNRGVTS